MTLAAELGLEITADEMDTARQEFVGGRLVVDGKVYKPDPRKLRQMQIRRSAQALLRKIAEDH